MKRCFSPLPQNTLLQDFKMSNVIFLTRFLDLEVQHVKYLILEGITVV